MRIEEITEYYEFKSLQENWNELLTKSYDNNIFLTWEYISAWWETYGKEHNLMILVAKEQNKIVALAPLMRSNYRLFGLNLRKIEFIGANKHTDYCNFILIAKKVESLKLFLAYLNDYPSEWDCLEFRGIPEEAESITLVRQFHEKMLALGERTLTPHPYLSLPVSVESLRKGLGRHKRNRLRSSLRKLSQQFETRFDSYCTSEEIQNRIVDLFELHQKRWNALGFPGLFSEQKFKDLLRRVVICVAEKGWVNLSILSANARPIAAGFFFEYNEKAYYYNSGFDPLYSEYSPSNLLLLHLLEDSITRGLKEFDFLRGVEAYKQSWNTVNRQIVELTKSKGLIGNLYSSLKKSDNLIVRKIKNTYNY
jgi:CelD/BcsL family acetyltransferase involved in cellulose biosynthesis